MNSNIQPATNPYRLIFNKQLDELRHCRQEDVSKHIMPVFESFLFVDRTEQEFYANSIFDWAKQHESDKPKLFAYANLIKAFFYFYGDNYEQALPMLVSTEALFNELNDQDGSSICLGIQGSIYRTFGIVDLSLKCLWSSYEQLRLTERFQLFTMAMGVLRANIFVDQKHYDDAIGLYDTMLRMPEKHFKFYWSVYSLHGLGKIYLIQKNLELALHSLEKSMSIAEEHNHPLSISNSLSELGNYYNTVGNYNKAEQYHLKALELREEKKFTGGAITSCIKLAENYLAQSKLDTAQQFLERGLNMAESLKVKPKMYQIHRLLSDLYERRNELDKSLLHYKRYHQLHDEVEEEDNARKVKNVQLIFEAEQTKKENVIIKKQKEEIEKKNIELQETIDELTRARIGKKARAITLLIAIILFIFEDTILHFALKIVNTENYFISLIVKMVIIFSLAPINKVIEKYLLNKVIRKKKELPVAQLVL